jgi:hypothetical protein
MAATPLSLRIDRHGRARLADYAGRRGQSQHTLALQLLEEGLRMLKHSGIVFRDGPSGRRAALVAGPDVWEVVGGLRGADGEAALDEAAEDLGLSRAQVDAALRYYGEYGQEIDERIRRNAEEADRRAALFRAGRDALA